MIHINEIYQALYVGDKSSLKRVKWKSVLFQSSLWHKANTCKRTGWRNEPWIFSSIEKFWVQISAGAAVNETGCDAKTFTGKKSEIFLLIHQLTPFLKLLNENNTWNYVF